MLIRSNKWSTAGRKSAPGGFFDAIDFLQLFALAGLFVFGLTFIYTTGESGGYHQAFIRQVQWIGLGGALWLIGTLLDYRSVSFRLLTIPVYLAVVVLLVLTLTHGVRVYGATRWLEIASVRIQPSEFAKTAMVLLLAVVFSVHRFDVNKKWGIFLSLLIFAPPFLLVAKEPDLGSALILIPAYIGIVFCAGLKWRYIIVSSAVVLLIGGMAIVNETYKIYPLLKDYQRDRIKVFLKPDSDRLNRGYNAYQARLTVGSGGMWGKGIGNGEQNTLGFLPKTVANNDFIFSVIAEETGFSGACLLLLLYGMLLFSIWRAAFLSCDEMGRIIAVGAGCVMTFHVIVNIGMSVGLMPVTGLPLPFVSYGGSFMLSGMGLCGVLQSVYRYRKRG